MGQAYPAKNSVLKVVVKGTPTAMEARSFEINTARGTIDASTLSTDWKKYLTGQADWTGSFELFYDPDDNAEMELVNGILNGVPCSIIIQPLGAGTGKTQLSGDCLVNSWRLNGATEDAVGSTIGFQGTDALTLSANAS